MSDYGLVPKYTDADFQTLVDRLKSILSKSDTFKDYDFEGANITLLMELLSYVGDLNTFYTNRLAQNIHTDTANIYEVVHSLVRQQGYVPTGPISAEVTITVRVRRRDDGQTISYFDEDDQLYIPKWFKLDTGLTTDDGDSIYYCLSEDYTFNVTDLNILSDYDAELDITYEYVEFDVVVKQGEPLQSVLTYTGEDIISNEIVLPLQSFDMGQYPYENSLDSLLVTVGNDEVPWSRVSDFFDDISGLQDEENVYIFYYDKYKRTVLAFSNSRNVPSADETIMIYPIKTLGTSGSISVNTFGDDNKPDVDTILGVTDIPFLTNITSDQVMPLDRYTVTNTSASVGGSDVQDIDELKAAGKAYGHSQLRNVTKSDYMGNLTARGDVTVANVWGEHEQNPQFLDTRYFNKAYISLIPTEWSTDVDNNIRLVEIEVPDEFSGNIVGNPLETLSFPENYNNPISSLDDFVYTPSEPPGTIEAGTYLSVETTTDGTGSGATVDVVVVEAEEFTFTVTVNDVGYGYAVGDTITINEADVEWSDGTGTFDSVVATVDGSVNIYNPDWQTQLLEYLEPHKMLGIWEEFISPELVYFRFDFGLKVKRTYSFTQVKQAIKNKLNYYFQNSNREFGEMVDFREIYNYIVDTSNVSPDDDFSLVKGIHNLVVRDVMICRDPSIVRTIDDQDHCEAMGGSWETSCSIVPDELYIFPDNVHNYFPHFVDTGYGKNDIDDVYNTLLPVQLGHNQFPQLANDFCIFTNEG